MQLAFAAGGAALGAFFAPAGFAFMGMSGASLGWTAGSLIGGLFADNDVKLPAQFGPRLGDLKVQSSTYGSAIPRAFGTVRIAGNIIWAPDIHETATTQTQETGGGKGGGAPETSQQQTTYSYSADFAIAICEGPITGIGRVWANGKLLTDYRSSAPIRERVGGGLAVVLRQAIEAAEALGEFSLYNSMVVYLGSETQPADPTILAVEGEDATPAYRGTAYVVFTGLKLEQFGNRIPNLEFEVVVNGTAEVMVPNLFYTLPDGLSYFDQSSASDGSEEVNLRRNSPGATHYWTVLPSASPVQPQIIALFDNYTGQLVLQHNAPANTRLLSENGLNGRMWYFVEGWGVYALSMTGEEWFFGAVGGDHPVQVYEFRDQTLIEDDEIQEEMPEIYIQRVNPGPGSTSILHGNAVDIGSLETVNTGLGSNNFFDAADRITGRIYIRCTSFGGAIDSTIGYCEVGSSVFNTIKTYTDTAEPGGMVGRDGYLYVRSADTGSYNVIEKLDQDGALIDSITLPGISTSSVEPIRMVQDMNGLLYVQVDREIFRINYGTMELIDQATFTFTDDWIMPNDAFEGKGILVSRGQDGYRDKLYMLGDGVTPAAPLLSDVVTDLCLLTGLTESDLDVSQLTADTVSGYVIARRATVRSMIEPLMGTYFFDAVESDNKIKFVKRGSSVAVTIPESDLSAHTGAIDEVPDPLRVVRKQELELPVEVNVAYLNRAIDYQVSQQPSRRLITQSKQSVTLQVPIVLTDDEAKRIADKHIFSAWVERESHEFETGREYSVYEPCDVVGVVKAGVTHNVRITQKDEGGDGVIRWKAVADYASVYTQVSTGVAAQVDSQTVTVLSPTNIEFLDVPLLRNQDDDAGFYFAAGGQSNDWRGVNLYQSTDSGVTYSPVGELLPESTIGYTTDVLGDYDEELNELIDESSSVTVVINNGDTLASVTRDELLNGANPAVIGGEIVQFRDVVLVDTDTYVLTGFLRGRRGSESFMGSHVAGDRFVLLNNNLRTVPQTVSLKGQALLYKPVSIGRTLEATNAKSFINSARRKLPLAPVQVGGGKNTSGDWLFQWRRQTRYDALWLEAGEVPLGENIEAYEVDIKQADEVVRTIETSTPSATYTSAQQITDFGAVRSGLSIEVYQISSEVGRGYGTAKVFTNSAPAYYWKIHNVTVPDATWFQLWVMKLISDTGVDLIATPAGSGQNMTFTVPGMGGSGSGTISHFVFSGRNFYELFLDPATKNTADSVQCQHSAAPAGGIVMTWNFSSIGKVTIAGVKQAPFTLATNRHMSGFTLSRSDDGVTWIEVGTKSGLVEPPPLTLSAEYDF